MAREIRVHKKSRKGCRNCKLRKIKCDEIKPHCKACRTYHVLCNYDGTLPDLQLAAFGASKLELADNLSIPQNQSISYHVAPVFRSFDSGGSERPTQYQCDQNDLYLLRKFQGRTVCSMSSEMTLPAYQDHIVRLACSHPYLLHSILALTLMHDRSLSSVTSPLTRKEAFHWYQSLTLFNAKLSSGADPLARDPLWITAMGLGIVSFYYVEGDSPNEAWPLKASSALDLNWLKMIDGKKEVWRVAGPPTETSLFEQPYPQNVKALLQAPTGRPMDNLPPTFIRLYDLQQPSCTSKNPYLAAATLLAEVLPVNDLMQVLFAFLAFVGDMSDDYKRLLERKDVRALLLLAYWYATVCLIDVWWLSRRALLEGQAICRFIEQSEQYDVEMAGLLLFPKSVFATRRACS